ncbi:MAG TPA: flagellar basal-body MS-ring/collar protein FliF [Sedimentisphaerales bacterium]|nr:flagellar basal-body MS-ring/collar protein FliF [Sedimentisphaerales bacterium]
MGFFHRIRAIWEKIGLVQRALLVAIAVTFVIVGGLLIHWAQTPDMRVLYQDLAPEEAAQITEKISEKAIAYELRNGGTSIYVPKQHVYQLRLDMAKEGLPTGDQGGYKIFDNEKIGISPFVQSVNLNRALQDELAKSIQMIDGVEHARVHIVRSEQTLFTSEAGKTTASVVLRLKPGYRLSALNIAAITHLVSGSVEGLSIESVTVIDSQGRLLSGESDRTMAGGAGTVQDYRERVEQNLEDKVEQMLTTVLGPGRAKVRIHAVLDMNSVSTVTEKYEPKGVATKEEITTGSETGANGATAAGNSAKPGTTKKDETIVTEYQVGKTVTQEVVLPGEIKSLSVAAVVDLSPVDANEAQAKIMDPNDVEKLIENALGLDLAGADSLKVVDVKFQNPAAPLLSEETDGGLDFVAVARQASLGIMAVCALLVLRMFRGARKKAGLQAAANRMSGAEGFSGLLPGGTSVPEPALLRRQIAGVLEQDPERARQLFASWLEDKGS